MENSNISIGDVFDKFRIDFRELTDFLADLMVIPCIIEDSCNKQGIIHDDLRKKYLAGLLTYLKFPEFCKNCYR